MIRFRPLPWMSAFSAIALVILILLGNWQWRRYHEKLNARARPPAEMVLTGATPLHGKVQLVYALNDDGPAWRVFAPVAHDGVTTFVDTGAGAGLKPPDWRAIAEPFGAGDIGLKGMKVIPQKAPWTAAKSNPAAHTWFAIDLPAMGAAAGVNNVTPYYLALPYIGPTGALIPNPFANALASDPLPPERHFGYALTWWGLAGTLVGVYAAFHIRAGRLGFGRKT